MKKIFYIIVAAALVCGCAKDEGGEASSVTKIHGTVVTSGEPVNAAAILLTPGGGVKITGSDGMYEFADLQPGRYELKVFKEGFQGFNKSIDVAEGKDEEVAVTLTPGAGNLSINKGFIDMGGNESNNVAGFTIINKGNADLEWQIVNATPWITKIDPKNGTAKANSAEAVSFTINRSKLSVNAADNYATILLKSITAGDGSNAELLVSVFGTGDGTNIVSDNSDEPYIIIGDLYVRTIDGGQGKSWYDACIICESCEEGGYDDWRLPDIYELSSMYANKEAIGGFEAKDYWSNQICIKCNMGNGRTTPTKDTWDFETGDRGVGDSYSFNSVRCVRRDAYVIPSIGIAVQNIDISDEPLSWSNANNLCQNSTVGGYNDWRLPTSSELAAMYNNKRKIGGLNEQHMVYYWSSNESELYTGIYYATSMANGATTSGSSGETGSSVCYARAVRTLP